MSFDEVLENTLFRSIRCIVSKWLMQRMSDSEKFELLEFALGKPYHVRVTFEIYKPSATVDLAAVAGAKEYR